MSFFSLIPSCNRFFLRNISCFQSLFPWFFTLLKSSESSLMADKLVMPQSILIYLSSSPSKFSTSSITSNSQKLSFKGEKDLPLPFFSSHFRISCFQSRTESNFLEVFNKRLSDHNFLCSNKNLWLIFHLFFLRRVE